MNRVREATVREVESLLGARIEKYQKKLGEVSDGEQQAALMGGIHALQFLHQSIQRVVMQTDVGPCPEQVFENKRRLNLEGVFNDDQ